jgi:hypothetical protein
MVRCQNRGEHDVIRSHSCLGSPLPGGCSRSGSPQGEGSALQRKPARASSCEGQRALMLRTGESMRRSDLALVLAHRYLAVAVEADLHRGPGAVRAASRQLAVCADWNHSLLRNPVTHDGLSAAQREARASGVNHRSSDERAANMVCGAAERDCPVGCALRGRRAPTRETFPQP